jgi:hypothetical protein
MTKQNMERASVDVGLIMIAYNLRRLINIVGLNAFMKWALQQVYYFLKSMVLLEAKLASRKVLILFPNNISFNFQVCLKPLYLRLN